MSNPIQGFYLLKTKMILCQGFGYTQNDIITGQHHKANKTGLMSQSEGTMRFASQNLCYLEKSFHNKQCGMIQYGTKLSLKQSINRYEKCNEFEGRSKIESQTNRCEF